MDAWYIVPALKHYNCLKLATKQTYAVRLTDTIKLKNYSIPISEVTSVERIVKATKALFEAVDGYLLAYPPD